MRRALGNSLEAARPAQPCPQCGELLTMSSEHRNVNVAVSPGDYSVCPFCGAVAIYDALLKLVLIPVRDQARLAVANPGRWHDIFRAVRFVKAKNILHGRGGGTPGAPGGPGDAVARDPRDRRNR